MAKAANAAGSAPVYALLGADPFLQLQELACISAKLPPDFQRMDYDGDTAQLGEVLDDLRSFAMFGGVKVVVVRNADAFVTRFREQLEEYVESPSNSGTLILRLSSLPKVQRIYKFIQKLGGIVECEPPKDLARWSVEHAKKAHDVTLLPDAARMLAELIGADLGRLDTEIAKLAISADGGKITGDLVAGQVAFSREREMRDLTVAMALGSTKEALKRWRELVQTDKSAEFRAFVWLGMWLEDVAAVVNQSPAANKLSWKYRDQFPKFLTSAKAMGKSGHARALDLLAEIEKQSKSGVGDAVENVERFILALSPNG